MSILMPFSCTAKLLSTLDTCCLPDLPIGLREKEKAAHRREDAWLKSSRPRKRQQDHPQGQPQDKMVMGGVAHVREGQQ